MKSARTTALLMLLVFLLVVSVVIIFLTGLDRPTQTDNPYQNVTSTAVPTVAVETPAPTAEVETPAPAPSVASTSAPVYYPPSTSMPSQTAQPVSTATPPPAGVSVPSGSGATTTTASAASPSPVPGADSNMLPAQDLIPVVPGATVNGTGTDTADASVIPAGTSLGSGTFRSDSGASINIHADWTALVRNPNTVEITITAYVDSYSLFTTATPEALNISVDGQYISLASPAIEIPTTTTPVATLINDHTFTVSLTGGETRSIPVEVVWNYRGTYGSVYLDTIECGGNITLSR